MMNISWDNLRILLVALECESLSDAARKLNVSQPTVGRAIKNIERSYGRSLLIVTQSGIRPTEDGLRLLPFLKEMQAAAAATNPSVMPSLQETPTIRVACGPWLAGLFSQHAKFLAEEPTRRQLDIHSSVLFADMPRAAADIAFRSRRPTKGKLKVRALPHYSYAAYGQADLVAAKPPVKDSASASHFDWAMLSAELDHFPTSQWLLDIGAPEPVVRCSSSSNLLDAVLGGNLLAVIPCFIGDRHETLKRASAPFVPTDNSVWMVLPEDVSHRPDIRAAADRFIALFDNLKNILNPKE